MPHFAGRVRCSAKVQPNQPEATCVKLMDRCRSGGYGG